MGALPPAQAAAYARKRIRAADLILADHTKRGLMCSCGRVAPCSVAATALSGRAHFVAVLAQLDATTVRGRAVAPGSVPVPRSAPFKIAFLGTQAQSD